MLLVGHVPLPTPPYRSWCHTVRCFTPLSWFYTCRFYTCDLTRLHTRFAAQAGYQTFDLTAGFEAFGKFPTRKDPYAAVAWRRAAPPAADGRWPALPPTLSDTVELSVLMQVRVRVRVRVSEAVWWTRHTATLSHRAAG